MVPDSSDLCLISPAGDITNSRNYSKSPSVGNIIKVCDYYYCNFTNGNV